MNKIGIISIVILITAIIGISGCIYDFNNSSNSPQNYTGYGVSFTYPGNWHVSTDNRTGNNVIIASKADNFFSTTQFQVTIVPNGFMSQKSVIDMVINSEPEKNWTRISNKTMVINNTTSYEGLYLVNDTHFPQEMKVEKIYVVTNRNTYILLFQAVSKDFDAEKTNFDLIFNSFRIS